MKQQLIAVYILVVRMNLGSTMTVFLNIEKL
nr:MAG TPA: hypothetical protein [Caudoviricetes sp.]